MKKRTDGRYCKNIQIGMQPNGKRLMKTVYGQTIREVEQKELAIKMELEQGIYVDDNAITVSEWSKQWLDVYKADVEYNTVRMYKNVIDNHIVPSIGDVPLQKLRTIHLQGLINSIVKDGKTRTAQICRQTLRQIVKQAVHERIIGYDISEGLKSVKLSKSNKRALSEYEKNVIESAKLSLRERLFIDLLRYAGLRRGEALALKKADIDISKGIISIRHSVYFEENDAGIKRPKSVSSIRDIPMPDVLKEEMEEYLIHLDGKILFSMNSGEYMSKSSFRKFWERIIRNLNSDIEDRDKRIKFSPHICRHTYATDLYYAGVDVKMAQHLLGHASLSMTLDVYTHLDKAKTYEAIEKLNDYIVSENKH